jgi:DNA mismatch repair protein MSH2
MSNLKQHSSDPIVDKEFLTIFKNLPEKSLATIRFFDRGEYFSLHGSDALYAAKEFFKTKNVIKMWKSISDPNASELETCYVKTNNFEAFLKDLLLVKQYRVEIWKRNTNSNKWTMTNHGSPGNLSQFEDIIYSNEDADSASANAICDPGLIAIQIINDNNINKLALGHIDKTARNFLVATIALKDNFTDLESLIIHLGPKECLIPSSGGNRDWYAKLLKVLEKSRVLVTERKRTDFSADNLCTDLNMLVKSNAEQNVANLSELKDKSTVECLNALIKYLELTSDSSNEKKFKIVGYNLNHFLKLDSSAFRSLNLLPVAGSADKTHSVFGILNKCCTVQGQRMLTQWIKQPLVDIVKIGERQNIVEILVRENELRQVLIESYLKRVPDFQKIEWRFIKNKANLQDCYKVYCVVQLLPKLLATLEGHDGENSYLFKDLFSTPLTGLMENLKAYKAMIEKTLDIDAITTQNLFLVKSSFEPELEEIRNEMNEIERKIVRLTEKVTLDLKNRTVKLESNAQYGYYFRLSRKDDDVLRNNKNFTVLRTNNDGIRFQNEKLEKLNAEFIEMRERYEQGQKVVVDDVIRVALGYLDDLQSLNNLIAELDIYISFALVVNGSQMEYIKPQLHPLGSGILKLTESRHPCLEVQDGINFIPNDVDFIKGEKDFCILTGPNMGGKSTYVRQIGILVLMAQLGSFVPASKAEITIVDSILARIGANDCQNKGVSTFMAEMLETSFILKTATCNSLVIVDELGRGTSTYDGFGLAWAISEFLVKKVKCFTLFATHFHELTALSEEIKTVFNCHVSAVTNAEALTLLYKVKPGVCDQSFGIHVAHLANFPQHVIDFAKEKAKYLEDYCPLLANDEQTEDHSKKYKYKQETNGLIEDCFKQIEELDSNSMNDEEYIAKIHQLIQDQAKNVENPYFKMLVDKL